MWYHRVDLLNNCQFHFFFVSHTKKITSILHKSILHKSMWNADFLMSLPSPNISGCYIIKTIPAILTFYSSFVCINTFLQAVYKSLCILFSLRHKKCVYRDTRWKRRKFLEPIPISGVITLIPISLTATFQGHKPHDAFRILSLGNTSCIRQSRFQKENASKLIFISLTSGIFMKSEVNHQY